MSRRMKTAIIALALVAVVATSGFSLGLGLAYGLDPIGGLAQDVMLSAKFDEFPALLGIGFRLADPVRVGLTADWWMATGNLVGFINYYAGPGLYAGVGAGLFDIGLRIPIGLNAYPIPELELFLEVAPTIGYNSATGDFPDPGAQGAIGFRFWF
ncbi:MAG: hypothetical protein ACOC1U_09075 [Spirochaetota bacterium]